jgi:hypothetical protein
MQNLFEFNQHTGLIQMNRVWISMVPEFKTILIKSKPCNGDYDGRKKLYAQRIFTFIYMMVDFKSPLRDMDEDEKRKEALRCAELEETDITETVKVATGIYEWYQENAARSLRTVKAMRKGLDEMDKYFQTVNFKERDKKGEMVHNAKDLIANMKSMKGVYESYKDFEDSVFKELLAEETVRGDRKLGGKEGKRTGWQEGKRPDTGSTEFKEFIGSIFGSVTTEGEGDDPDEMEDDIDEALEYNDVPEFDPDAED